MAVAVGGFTLGAVSSEPCQVESAYYCMRGRPRPVPRHRSHPVARRPAPQLRRPRRSHVLEFDYTRSFSDAVDAAFPEGQALDALHVGGGGFTFPRYLAATRPGTRSTVLEIDPAVRDLARDELGLRTSPALRVRIGDARLGIRDEADDSRDLVVGDAFGSLSVPWHLTTREFAREIDRVLRPGGRLRAERDRLPELPVRAAAARDVARAVRRTSPRSRHAPFDDVNAGGNVVLIASDRPIDRSVLTQRAAAHGDVLLDGAALDRFIGSAPVITDDFAPIDQWLREDSIS